MSPVVPLGIAALIVVWALRAWLHPFAPCTRCSGTGKNTGSTKRRFGNCKRCSGSGRRQVLGSKTVHRAVRSLRKRGKS